MTTGRRCPAAVSTKDGINAGGNLGGGSASPRQEGGGGGMHPPPFPPPVHPLVMPSPRVDPPKVDPPILYFSILSLQPECAPLPVASLCMLPAQEGAARLHPAPRMS